MIHRRTLSLAYWNGANGVTCHYQRSDYRRAYLLGVLLRWHHGREERMLRAEYQSVASTLGKAA